VKTLSSASQQQYSPFERVKGKPFWIWNIEEHKLQDITTSVIVDIQMEL